MPSIFLSHSSQDNAFARKLAEELSAYGVKVWIDEAELNIGDSFLSKISSEIDKSDYVGAILSHTSVKSKWVLKELEIAMTKEIEEHSITVLPILIERCEIPTYLASKLYVDFTDPNDFDGPLSKLLHTLGITSPINTLYKKPIDELKERILLILNGDNYKPLTSHGIASKMKCNVTDIRLILRLLENEMLVDKKLSGKFLVYRARSRT